MEDDSIYNAQIAMAESDGGPLGDPNVDAEELKRWDTVFITKKKRGNPISQILDSCVTMDRRTDTPSYIDAE